MTNAEEQISSGVARRYVQRVSGWPHWTTPPEVLSRALGAKSVCFWRGRIQFGNPPPGTKGNQSNVLSVVCYWGEAAPQVSRGVWLCWKGDQSMTLLEHAISYTDELVKVLEAKNKSYGNSVEEPIRIFSRADPETALRVRIDDKLSRIARGEENAFNEDTHLDLVGYLLLLGGLKRKQGQKLSQESVNKLIDKAIEEMEATPKQLLCLIANPAGFRCDHGLGHKGHHRNSVARVNFQSPDDLGWYGAWDSRRPSNGKEPLSDSRRPAESE